MAGEMTPEAKIRSDLYRALDLVTDYREHFRIAEWARAHGSDLLDTIAALRQRVAEKQDEADKYHQLLCVEIERVKEARFNLAAAEQRAAQAELHAASLAAQACVEPLNSPHGGMVCGEVDRLKTKLAQAEAQVAGLREALGKIRDLQWGNLQTAVAAIRDAQLIALDALLTPAAELDAQ